MKKMNNILVVGGDGFLGWNLCNKLKDSFNLFVLERNISKLRRLNHLKPQISIYDINKDDVNEIIKENRIDLIINTATDYGKEKDISTIYESNVLSCLKLIELAIKNNVKGFINTDSFYNKPGNHNYSHLSSYIYIVDCIDYHRVT